jgi:K+-sensing histidine kinase KdpD
MSLDINAGSQRGPSLSVFARYGLTLMLLAAATFGAVIFEQLTGATNLSLVFVLPVVIAAASFGWGPSLAAAVGGTLAFNFFLIAPRYTLRVNSPENVWGLLLLLATAALVSAVAAQSRRRADAAWQAADQAMALQALAKSLMAASDRDGIASASADAVGRLFGAPAVVLLDNGDDLAIAATACGARLTPADHEAARWALASRLATRGGAYPVEEARFDFWPIVSSQRQGAAIGQALQQHADGRPAGAERLIDIVRGYVAVALDREHFAGQALDTRLEVESQRLKADLLAAVSHDLKTPLSTILFTLQSLQKFAGEHDDEARAQLLGLAEKETARLGGLVANLLDMGRLDAGAVVVRARAVRPADLVTAALDAAASALAGHPVLREGGRAAKAVLADAQLAQTALGNILENAGKYAPAGSAIRVRLGADDGVGWIEVEDEGPGFPEPIEPLFEKFARGVEGDGRAPGTGLGLAIARGFAQAQGGRVEASNRPDGRGARVRLVLPLSADQPA